ncbi:hypothetical protein GWE18_00505 [Bradyrhizobium sp. CSA112]|uniref:hypothetical protein n=1 Tax=Bradyrhizobium sp. CSA112 TaxID=2699170 RepID=UPI0023B0E145|nr:hypothetical protein [Bradyrhizobium sp. CSA112]MDE5451357.1 hypothetical protein [Bradyrhizobium sp. CSA112]
MTDVKAAFYGAQCPWYPDCKGGCGLGCTRKMRGEAATRQEPVAWQYRYKRWAGEWSEWSTLSDGWDGWRNPDNEYRPLYAGAAKGSGASEAAAPDKDQLFEQIFEVARAWEGASGGVYALRAMCLELLEKVLLPHIQPQVPPDADTPYSPDQARVATEN